MTDRYPIGVWVTLSLMILTGAARTIAIKVYFQLGYDDPLLVLVSILIAHGFALPIYWVSKCIASRQHEHESDEEADEQEIHTTITRRSSFVKLVPDKRQSDDTGLNASPTTKRSSTVSSVPDKRQSAVYRMSDYRRLSQAMIIAEAAWQPDDDFEALAEEEVTNNDIEEESYPSVLKSKEPKKRDKRGSLTGLTRESKQAVAWVHKLPHWTYPVITGVLNMLDILFRTSAILYLDASIASMMFCGLELIASIFAGKFVRKRSILRERWCGAGVMVVGLVLVGLSDFVGTESEKDTNSDSNQNFGLGMLFVILKVLMDVLKSLAQELFMQEAAVPAALLLGLEGCYGVMMAVPLYFAAGPSLGYYPIESFQKSFGSMESVGYTLGFMVIILCAGMCSLMATSCTSAMTRNMWKNFRGLVVSRLGL